ncbi:ABC transporter permease subunit [Rhizomonospora bruguierae]|uniref:ABC transporter permease subunit n=1 Tax=Rhizomonospora bruguierae TaxID=1581705 RepID=UPI001BD07C0F|nr:ABC transporter permease subunit [Micromonospora sp. NBRC 107566]
MIVNLVRAEVVRLAARRFVGGMLALLLGALVITFATTVASSHAPSQVELDQARVSMQEERARIVQTRQECREAQAKPIGGWPGVDCERQFDPDRVRVENFLDGVFVFAGSIRSLVLFLTAFLALFGFLVGASFVGAELASGGMTNLLLWRPQRLTVLGTKLGVLLAAVLALSVVVTAGYLGVFRLLAEVGGTAGDTGGTFWPDLLWLSVRGILLAVGATALGFVLATVGRHTAAALGALAAYAVVWELGGRIVAEMIRVSRPSLLFLGTYLAAWLDGDIRLHDTRCGFADPCVSFYTITWVESGAVMFVALAAALVATFALFRRRDLT